MAEPQQSRRERRWSRSPPPHDWRWVVGGIGRVLIAIGLLMFGFVAYQLWGTGIQYAQAQDRLDDEFAELLANAPTVTAAAPATTDAPATSVARTTPATTDASASTVARPTTSPGTTVPPSTVPNTTSPAPPIVEGDALARMEAPTIGLDAIVVAGVSAADLQDGPGHYPDTPLPGQLGNTAIAGHRTTYGQPFFRVDELRPGDEIVVTTVAGRFTYRVTGSQIVSATDSHVIATADATVATLTLTSCHPKYTARDRIIVSAALDESSSPAPAAPTPSYDRDQQVEPSATLPGGPPATTVASTTQVTQGSTLDPISTAHAPVGGGTQDVGDAFDQGWFDDDAAFGQVALWGFALTGISIGAYFISRAARTNWAGGLAGVIPFVVSLYFFFQNVNRLLPAAL